jgi:hypothetical protein
MTPVKVCSICGGAIVGFGNDAWPVVWREQQSIKGQSD